MPTTSEFVPLIGMFIKTICGIGSHTKIEWKHKKILIFKITLYKLFSMVLSRYHYNNISWNIFDQCYIEHPGKTSIRQASSIEYTKKIFNKSLINNLEIRYWFFTKIIHLVGLSVPPNLLQLWEELDVRVILKYNWRAVKIFFQKLMKRQKNLALLCFRSPINF